MMSDAKVVKGVVNVVCSNIICNDDGHFLFVEEAKDSGKNSKRYSFPAGKIEIGESLMGTLRSLKCDGFKV